MIDNYSKDEILDLIKQSFLKNDDYNRALCNLQDNIEDLIEILKDKE